MENKQQMKTMTGILMIVFYLIMTSQHNMVDAVNLSSERESNDNGTKETIREVCESSTCKDEASFIKNKMNEKINPCTDFYEFACGGFKAEFTEIPGNRNLISIRRIIQDELMAGFNDDIKKINPDDSNAYSKMKQFYQICINQQSITEHDEQQFLELINQTGGWPMLVGNEWMERSYNWEETYPVLREKGLSVEFPMLLGSDKKDDEPWQYAIYPPKSKINKYKLNNNETREAYKAYMTDIAVMLGGNNNSVTKDVEECFEFELKLHEMTKKSDAPSETQSITQLSQNYSHIPWTKFLNGILERHNLHVNENDTILISKPNYVSAINDLIANTPKRILANYQMWYLIDDSIDIFPKEFFERNLAFQKFHKQTNYNSRADMCLKGVKDSFPGDIDALYVKKYVNKNMHRHAKELINNIRMRANESLNTIDWIDNETKKFVINELETMDVEIGTTNKYYNDAIEKIYEKFDVIPGDYLKTSLNLQRFIDSNFFARFNESVEFTSRWSPSIEKINVDPINILAGHNSLVIPEGVLLGYNFTSEQPEYLNYGALGSVLGIAVSKQILIAIDNYEHGFKKDLLNANTAIHTEKLECMVDRFNDYIIKDIDLKVNGNRSLRMNIAANGGIKWAYDAYNVWVKLNNKNESPLPGLDYTPQQMFWIRAAINQCGKYKPEYLKEVLPLVDVAPLEARVNVGFSNYREFHHDFHCEIPKETCNVW